MIPNLYFCSMEDSSHFLRRGNFDRAEDSKNEIEETDGR